MSDDDQTVRQWLVEKLEPLIPDKWTINPSMGMPETISKITLSIKHLKIEPLDAAPFGHLDNSVTITVAEPHDSATERAEELLDDEVVVLITALQGVAQLTFKEATKVLVNETYLGWDISCSIISKKKEDG